MNENKKKIVIIDDDDGTRELYANVFRSSGYEILEAKDGLEGLDLITQENPDVVFTGIVMPRMDGFSMFESMKKNVATADIPVIISSHLGREEDRRRAESLGARDFIIKGMTKPREVVERINSLFDKKEYLIKFETNSENASKLAKEIGIANDFVCQRCGGGMVLKLIPQDYGKNIFKVEGFCQKCE